MKCLHICNDLIGSKVHENLYTKLAKFEIEQTVFYSTRPKQHGKVNKYKKSSALEIIDSKAMKRYHRLFFRNKISFLYKDLIKKVNIEDYSLLHATTLYSDGALALKIKKEWGIPYVVGIRGSDVNLFSKYRPDLQWLAREVLKNASKIIFISSSIEYNFYHLSYVRSIKETLIEKAITISNGIDDLWLKNIRSRKNLKPSRIIYIGNFTRNKNVKNLIKAFLLLHGQNKSLRLDLVGKGGADEKKIIELAMLNKDKINYHGPIYDKERLKAIYQNAHIFAMTSISETFGLVYLEALSQGIPIVCSKNQGIDHTFDHKIGEFVDPKSTDSIQAGLQKILTNYESYMNESIDFFNYDWKRIAIRYYGLYEEVVGEIASQNSIDGRDSLVSGN